MWGFQVFSVRGGSMMRAVAAKMATRPNITAQWLIFPQNNKLDSSLLMLKTHNWQGGCQNAYELWIMQFWLQCALAGYRSCLDLMYFWKYALLQYALQQFLLYPDWLLSGCSSQISPVTTLTILWVSWNQLCLLIGGHPCTSKRMPTLPWEHWG